MGLDLSGNGSSTNHLAWQTKSNTTKPDKHQELQDTKTQNKHNDKTRVWSSCTQVWYENKTDYTELLLQRRIQTRTELLDTESEYELCISGTRWMIYIIHDDIFTYEWYILHQYHNVYKWNDQTWGAENQLSETLVSLDSPASRPTTM